MNKNSITAAQIDALMEGVTVQTMVVQGTTTTVACALLPNGFSLGVATASCVDPANFDPELGANYATKKVLLVAREKLWELEGYRLKMALDQTIQRD